MRHIARQWAQRWTPGLVADRARAYERRLRQSSGRTALAERVRAEIGDAVSAGPFAGLSYRDADLSRVDAAGAKLLGRYEHEIAAPFAAEHPLFIDVGCADGYYAVGWALAHPTGRVLAFDLSRDARGTCDAVATANGVRDRVDVRGRFDLSAIGGLDLEDALVLVDVEGAEEHVLEPRVAERLHRATVIVELHEHLASGVGQRLRARFAATHAIEEITAEPPAIPDELAAWPPAEALAAVDELRAHAMSWLVMRPIATGR